MNGLIWFSKNILPALTAIITALGLVSSYVVKTDFDLVFEEKQTKLFTKSIKIFLSVVVIYVGFQFGAIAFSFSLKSYTFFTSPLFKNTMILLSIISILLVSVYCVLTLTRLAIPKTWSFIIKALTFLTKKLGFILYLTILITSMYIQSILWLPIASNISKTKFSNELILNLFISPLILVIFIFGILYLHNLNQGALKKYFYAMQIKSYDELKDLKLIHLYTRKTNEWIFVQENDFHEKKVLYLYEKDKEKWYEFTKTEIQQFIL